MTRSDPPRLVGRPRIHNYDAVQLNCKVHPAIKKALKDEAAKRGQNANSLLSKAIADLVGVRLEELVRPDDEAGVLRHTA
jgi:hypothetical protein